MFLLPQFFFQILPSNFSPNFMSSFSPLSLLKRNKSLKERNTSNNNKSKIKHKRDIQNKQAKPMSNRSKMQQVLKDTNEFIIVLSS